MNTEKRGGGAVQTQDINLNDIVLSKTNRLVTEDQDLRELAANIRTHGVRQPVLLRPKGKKFELVAGERRVRAARRAGLLSVPAIVKEMDDAEALEVQLLENIQRKDLTPLDEAFAYKRMQDELGYSVGDICTRMNKSDAHVYQTLSLTTLPTKAITALREGRLSKTVAVMIAQLEDQQLRVEATQALLPPEWDGEPTTAKAARSLIIKLKASANQRKKGRTTGKGHAPSVNKNGKVDYFKDWRYYLVRFDPQDFIKFKTICHDRHDQNTLAEAVFVVMSDKAATARGAKV